MLRDGGWAMIDVILGIKLALFYLYIRYFLGFIRKNNERLQFVYKI